ncbi:hypothetical protein MBLNU230_g6617t1 [Neophaeotheca triangularis]
MGIQALPQKAVRAIGASQVLTDPAAAVKELIDNALDAHATSIAVEISNNTVDVIQVRDNGHGIAPEDRSMVARRYCTSKISGEADLLSIGGSSLGFRGEALASAAEVCGTLTISTRVEGEPVATSLKISQQGEVLSHDRASFPVGTTVKLGDFIKVNPVRRQNILKNAEKCLKKIKQTMQAYALARPQTRLSLRVLKAKNDKGNFTYAPQSGANQAQSAALKVLGSSCISQCDWIVTSHEGFTMHAYLPRTDADPVKVSNVGSFISIDGRPVSTSRNMAKQLVKIFREALKGANNRFDGVKDPFIYLEVSCPAESYDANVEPAKDDVLFEDPDIVVECARRLFAEAFTDVEERRSREAKSTIQDAAQATTEALYHLQQPSLESPPRSRFSTPVKVSAVQPPHGNAPTVPAMIEYNEPPAEEQRSFLSNMYGCDDEDETVGVRPAIDRTAADVEELRQAKKDITVSNPWVMARMNASVGRPGPRYDTSEQPSSDTMAPPSSPIRLRQDRGDEPGMLPTPRPSSPPLPQGTFHPSNHVPGHQHAQDGRLIGEAALPLPATPYEVEVPRIQTPVANLNVQQRLAYNYNTAPSSSNPEPGTSLSAIPEAHRQPRRTYLKKGQPASVNKPFVPPTTMRPPEGRAWFDHLEGIERPSRPTNVRAPAHGLVRQGEMEDTQMRTSPDHNGDIRDWIGSTESANDGLESDPTENRRHPASKRRQSARRLASEDVTVLDEGASTSPSGVMAGRGFVPASEVAELQAQAQARPDNNPELLSRRRKSGGSRPLRQISGNVVDAADEEYLPASDKAPGPRRRRTTEAGDTTHLRRRKSSRLPLENVPAKRRTHNLVLTCDQGAGQKALAGEKTNTTSLSWNQPAVGAYGAFSQTLEPAELDEMTSRLRTLLEIKDPGAEVIHELRAVLSDSLAQSDTAMLTDE